MIAYFDCFSGISGDMTLSALIDLGVPLDFLKNTLYSLPLDGFDISINSVLKKGICGKQINITTDKHCHFRAYSDIIKLIEKSPLSDEIKTCSLSIFDCIAKAESKIHNCPKEEVHFHEIGAIDSIIDIVGTSICIDYLGIKEVYSSNIPINNSGFVKCHHGILPLPAPAALEILKDIPIYGKDIPFELVTPTGAGIIAVLSKSFGQIPDMLIKKIGYGAGSKDFSDIPNILRIISGQKKDVYETDNILIIETCIDDMNPEIFGFLMERLFEEGALDVYWIPVFMKKNRPGTLVHVLCNTDLKENLTKLIFQETTSIGVRYHELKRNMLKREETILESIYGNICVKKIYLPNGKIRLAPEYEACKKISIEKKIPLKNVYEAVYQK